MNNQISKSNFSTEDAIMSKAREDYLDKRIPENSSDPGVNPHLTKDSHGNYVNKCTGEIVWEA